MSIALQPAEEEAVAVSGYQFLEGDSEEPAQTLIRTKAIVFSIDTGSQDPTSRFQIGEPELSARTIAR